MNNQTNHFFLLNRNLKYKAMKQGNLFFLNRHWRKLGIFVHSGAFCHSQVVWTLSQAAADTAASALTSAGVSVRKAGRAKTAPSPAARTTARARGPAWKASVCATVISEERTAQSRGAPPTARAGVCASTASACARSPSPGRTAWSAGV